MIKGSDYRRFAYFNTPHGYGHAARAAAVMNAVFELLPGAIFEIYSRVPAWFFDMSNQGEYHYHEMLTDIGMAQNTSMDENLPETVRLLNGFMPFDRSLVQSAARDVTANRCEMILCDIAPLGIAVAAEAGLPSVLVENFTWDWIYQGYLDDEPGLEPYIRYLREIFASAGLHVRTQPACDDHLPAGLVTQPVSRKPRSNAEATRQRLGISPDASVVMITMGGILTHYPFLSRLEDAEDIYFLVPGGSDTYERRGSLVLIPYHSNLYHPDLVESSDVVVGKLGYSTLAETYTSGVPFMYIPRSRFPESRLLAQFARQEMGAVELPEERFFSGDWIDLLPELLKRPRRRPTGPNGADQIAQRILA